MNEENQSKYLANKQAEDELRSLSPEEIEKKFENVKFVGIDKKGREGFEVAIQVNGIRPSKTCRDRMKIPETIATVKALADIKLKQRDIDIPKESAGAKITKLNNVWVLTSKGKKVWTFDQALAHLKEHYKRNAKSKAGLSSSLSTCKMLRLELCGILPHGKDTLLTQIADDDIVEEYKEICQTDYNLLPQSIDHRLTCLNVMFKQAKKKQHFDGKYVCEKFNVKFGNTLYLKDHEVKEIQDRFEKMGKPEHRDCVIALVNLGCRQDDLWRITERDVDMNRPDPKVYIHASKDGIDRNLTIPQQLLPIIKQRLTGNPKMKLFPYSNSWMLGGWNRVRELMGHAKEKGWSPHVLRHTVGSRLAMANMSPQYIQQYLGHKSIQATFRYMHLAPKTTDACVDVINQINGDTTPVTHINKSTGDVEQLQLSEQQLQQVANFIVKLTAKPNGDLPNRHQVTKATQFISTDSKSVT